MRLHGPSHRLQLYRDTSNGGATASSPELLGSSVKRGLAVSQGEVNTWIHGVSSGFAVRFIDLRSVCEVVCEDHYQCRENVFIRIEMAHFMSESLWRMLSWTAMGLFPPAELSIRADSCWHGAMWPATTPGCSSTRGRTDGKRA